MQTLVGLISAHRRSQAKCQLVTRSWAFGLYSGLSHDSPIHTSTSCSVNKSLVKFSDSPYLVITVITNFIKQTSLTSYFSDGQMEKEVLILKPSSLNKYIKNIQLSFNSLTRPFRTSQITFDDGIRIKIQTILFNGSLTWSLRKPPRQRQRQRQRERR